MLRIIRALAPIAVAASLAVPGGAHATQTLTYAFAVPCDSPSGTTTAAGLGLPNGTYLVTVSGACALDRSAYSQPVGGTPCSVPVAGTIPCVPPVTTVNNVPSVNQYSTGGVYASTLTSGPGVAPLGCYLSITIDGVCFTGQAGLFARAGSGPMTVAFVDGLYSDNAGYLLVTVAWTP